MLSITDYPASDNVCSGTSMYGSAIRVFKYRESYSTTRDRRVIEKTSFQWVIIAKWLLSIGFGSAMGSPFPNDNMFPQLQMENFDAEKQLRPPYLTPPKLSRSSANFDDILQC